MFKIENDKNESLGDFPTLAKAQSFARKTKLTGYIFEITGEYWRYFEGRCNDKPSGRANRNETHK